jgi:hypothetical protein
MEPSEKVRENRLRRAAQRQGCKLIKSRRRDPHATGYGLYWLQGHGYREDGVTLDEAENCLTGNCHCVT